MSGIEVGESAARRAFGWFMLVALLVLAAGIGLRDPWPPDEPRFALVARQMIESGQWLFPHRGIELYSDKPPMLMWCEAALGWLLGGWRGVFLLPSLLAGLGTLALVYRLGRRLWDAQVGLIAAALVLLTLQFVDVVKHAQIDPLLLFWITLANTGIVLHCLRGPNWPMYWLGCFAAGIGVITKGVGVIALLMLIPYGFARARRWPGVTVTVTARAGWRWAGGALAFVLAIALWLLPMLVAAYGRRTPEYLAYVHDLLFRQTAERYASSWAHVEPFWFYLTVIPRDWFPTWLLLPALWPRWRQALRQREPRLLLPLVWCVLVVVFFSIPRGKRELYILPALPMLALAMAPYVGALLRGRWLPRLAFGLTVAGALLFLGAGAWAWLAQPAAARRIAAGYELAAGGHALWLCVLAVGVNFALAALWLRPRRGVAALLAGLAGAWIVWALGTYPLLDDNQSTRALMAAAAGRIGPGGELGLVLWREELMLQARGPVIDFGYSQPAGAQLAAAIAWQARAPGRRWILLENDALGDCIDRQRAQRLGVANRTEWWLVGVAAVKAPCANHATASAVAAVAAGRDGRDGPEHRGDARSDRFL